MHDEMEGGSHEMGWRGIHYAYSLGPTFEISTSSGFAGRKCKQVVISST